MLAFCKISETRHDFARLRYVKEDGLPDFLVRTETSVYVVETKEQRDNREWRYVLLGEASFYDWQSKGGRLADLLDFARVRPIGSVTAQQALI